MKSLQAATWLLVSTILLWVITPLIIFQFFGPAEGAGEFGDAYGVLTSLFTGLAFAGWFMRSYFSTENFGFNMSSLSLPIMNSNYSRQTKDMLRHRWAISCARCKLTEKT